MKFKEPPTTHVEPEDVRRKVAEAYRKLAIGRKFKPDERTAFARMADAWAATLPKK